MLILDLFLFACFAFATCAFHEQGHRIVAGQQWQGLEFKLPDAIYSRAFTKKMTVEQWIYYTLAGFIFSCPLIVLSFFILPGIFVAALILFNLWTSSIDFYSFFKSIAVISIHKPDFKTKLEDFNE